MYIRKTKTSNTATGEAYYTFRLVASERVNGKVRQKTLLNLGSSFSLPREHWAELTCRIDQILTRQKNLFEQTASKTVEVLAQRYAALLITKRDAETEEAAPVQPLVQKQNGQAVPEVVKGQDSGIPADFQQVDVNSVDLSQPRTVGVEHVGLHALNLLDFNAILEDAGLNRIQRVSAIGSVIARMAQPGSELASWQWLRESSALGELLDVDFETSSLMRLYRVSDLLINPDERDKCLIRKISCKKPRNFSVSH